VAIFDHIGKASHCALRTSFSRRTTSNRVALPEIKNSQVRLCKSYLTKATQLKHLFPVVRYYSYCVVYILDLYLFGALLPFAVKGPVHILACGHVYLGSGKEV